MALILRLIKKRKVNLIILLQLLMKLNIVH